MPPNGQICNTLAAAAALARNLSCAFNICPARERGSSSSSCNLAEASAAVKQFAFVCPACLLQLALISVQRQGAIAVQVHNCNYSGSNSNSNGSNCCSCSCCCGLWHAHWAAFNAAAVSQQNNFKCPHTLTHTQAHSYTHWHIHKHIQTHTHPGTLIHSHSNIFRIGPTAFGGSAN